MEGHSDFKNGKIHIKVANIKKFEALIEKVKIQSEELRSSVNELECFYIEIDFSTSDNEEPTGITS